MSFPTHVLVAPLNWGLGHASRCVPVIHYFLKHGSRVSIASDGDALQLLKDEFPALDVLELNSSQVTYSTFSFYFYLKLILQGFGLQKRALKDEKRIEAYVKKHEVDLLISDHRFGAFSKRIKSVIICHQLQFKAGLFSTSASWFNAKQLNRFDEIWIPDTPVSSNLSGDLSTSRAIKTRVRYIGVLSRFEVKESPQDIDYLAVISGPEPLRSYFETQLIHIFKELGNKKIVLVRGVYNKPMIPDLPHIHFHNHLKASELNQFLCRSQVVICRSGYSSVMDMACLGKRVFFVPTPHQGEQAYLAKRLEAMKIAPYTYQNKFSLNDLKRVEAYSGFNPQEIQQFPFEGFHQTLEA